MTIDEIKLRLVDHGYKLTSQRRAVLDSLLTCSASHLSSEEIYDLVRKDMPDIGVATVYRTLQLFCRLGIVSRILLDDNLARYEINFDKEEHKHHHLICEKCGSIQEVHVDLLEELEKHIESEFGFKIVNHMLGFSGYCKDCLSKQKEES